MNNRICIAVVTACLLAGSVGWAQGPSASLIATIEAKRGKTIPNVEAQDIRVTAAGKPATVTGLNSLSGSPMQLLLLIDDSASFSFGSEINTIKEFIRSLPPATQIAIGYMGNGRTKYAQQFTADHAAAADAIRLPLGPGGADVSPYDSLSDAIARWGVAPDIQRREVIIISSGIEGLGGGLAPENPYVNKAITDAQRAGVVVYGLYNPSVGHVGHTFWRASIGQNLLSQLCEETGGESYINMFGPAVDFTPYLREIEEAFGKQYLLTFSVPPVKKAGLVPVKVKIEEKDADIAAASAVYVKP
jgi:hypothetical protein